ncbi:Na(+)/citrate cotransporter [Dipodomys merriami]|uniref:Na(+)/citrate cotransporter n=1 Tax=Dipodomys merriami TaxID=94247 RepID=UPI0038559111
MPSLLKYVCKLKTVLILFCTPILLLPLILVVPGKAVRCAYVILLMAIYWCTDVIPMAITSLLPALLFPLLKIMGSKQVCVQYMTDTNMLFVGSMIVAVAVERWNLHKRIALKTLLIVGARPTRLMMGFMGVTAFLSMWISNTATTAMMVPILEAMLRQMEMTTAALEKPTEMEERGRGRKQDSHSAEKAMATEKKNMYKALNLSVCYAASIGGTATLTGTGPNVVLLGQMQELFPHSKDVLNFASWFAFAFPNMLLMLSCSWLWLYIFYMRSRHGAIKGKNTKEGETAAYLVLEEEYRKLGALSFPEISVMLCFLLLIVLWFTRDPGYMNGWLSIAWIEGEKKYCTDATAAIFVAVLLFVFPSKMPNFNIFNKSEADKKTPFYPPALLDWKGAQQKIPWGIVLLLGGGFALAKGCETSGLSEWMGKQLEPMGALSPTLITLVLALLVAMCTECTSNVATTTLFLPIFASMARSIGINPLLVMLPCTLSASFAFMLPVATPPNAIVFSYGHIQVSDMMKTGVMMNIIGIFCVLLSVNTWGRPIFDLGNFPEWANLTSTDT